MKNLRNIFSGIVSLILLLSMSIPTCDASQANPSPVSNVYVSGKIVDIGDDSRTENNPSYRTTSQSLWFNDPSIPGVTHVIKTYDNKGTIKHTRDGVEITVRREGQTSTASYTMINGTKVAMSCSSKIISSYPYQFIQDCTYTINSRYVPEDETCTIFTAGYLSLNNSKYTRYEVNVYIYWNDSDATSEAPSVSVEYTPVIDYEPNGCWLAGGITQRAEVLVPNSDESIDVYTMN